MALAEGKSEVRCGTGGLSLHTRYAFISFPSSTWACSVRTFLSTAMWLAQKLTNAKFEVEEEPSGHVIIRCQGIGYTAKPVQPSHYPIETD